MSKRVQVLLKIAPPLFYLEKIIEVLKRDIGSMKKLQR